MGEILHRYIFRETALTWLAVTCVLLLILLTDQFARVLGDAAGAEIPKDAIFAVMGLSSIRYLTILIPVGIFLAIMLAFARMYRDSEMAAMMSCGIGNTALYRPIAMLAIFLAVLVGWLSLFAGPSAHREVKTIMDNAKRNADLSILTSGRFTSIGRDDAVVYAEEVGEDGVLTNVFVQRRDNNRLIVIKAQRADQRNDLETGNKILTFYNGERYEGVPGSREFRITSFAEHGIPFELSKEREVKVRQEILTIEELLAARSTESIAELQWRVSVPVLLLVLAFIAVPLSRAPPRTGRYNRLVAGVLVYLTYSNLLGVAKIWVEQEVVPVWFGVWWVHLVFIGFGTILLMLQNRSFAHLFDRKALAGTAT
jgi:lipopolysaccharide export system permease protein